MEMETELVFTSFRDSIGLDGLKVSIDRHIPRLCSYPTMTFMLMPNVANMNRDNMERVCRAVLDNNWELIKDFVNDMAELGIFRIVFCDWATKEQIAHGKWCPAGIISGYIQNKIDQNEFEFGVQIKMLDGREVL